MTLNRRQLIHRGAAGAGLVFVGNLASLLPATASAAGGRRTTGLLAHRTSVRTWATGYGALVPDPGKLLDLPDGFSYTVVSEAGKPLTGVEGVLPDAFDGSALFESGNRRFLVRNSEQEVEATFPAVAAAELTYDPAAQGGTTTTELDADNNVVAEYVSLAGTVHNCAGGVTPWGTWLTCEETEDALGPRPPGITVSSLKSTRRAGQQQEPDPADGIGRFDHEAVAIDPATGMSTSPRTPRPGRVCSTGASARPRWAVTGHCATAAVLEALAAPTGRASSPTCPTTRCSAPP